MRKYQVEIRINDFEECRKLFCYADANDLYEALAAATQKIYDTLDPGVVKEEVQIIPGEELGWHKDYKNLVDDLTTK